MLTSEEILERWEGMMLTYREQDVPSSEPYDRTVPAWKCRRCSRVYGTSGLPPSSHRDCVGAVREIVLVTGTRLDLLDVGPATARTMGAL